MTDTERALSALADGRVVAAATESFFGLLADAGSPRAIDTLLRVKARGHEKGIGLVLPKPSTIDAWVTEVPPLARRLMAEFWPGALTIALSAAPHVDRRLLLNGRIAARFPVASPALDLSRQSGLALTATSANLPGQPPAIWAEEVRASFPQAIADGDLIVLQGSAPGGAPSSVVIVEGETFEVVRAGAVSRERIELARCRSESSSK